MLGFGPISSAALADDGQIAVSVDVSGLTAPSAVGSVGVLVGPVINVSGSTATSAIGSVAVLTVTRASVTGLVATSAVGSATVLTVTRVNVTGLAATAATAGGLIWGPVGPDANNIWTPIAP